MTIDALYVFVKWQGEVDMVFSPSENGWSHDAVHDCLRRTEAIDTGDETKATIERVEQMQVFVTSKSL